MNKINGNRLIPPPACALLILALTGTVMAQTPSALDPAQHPDSPIYESLFTDKMLPLDSQLSWTKRFNGDETFNSSEILAKPGSESVTSAPDTAPQQSSSGIDAIGVVKTLRISQGKVKIKHGPIDKYGMPAMTMVFQVSDPSLLDNLEKGNRIGFNIDNSSGGFVITNITPIVE